MNIFNHNLIDAREGEEATADPLIRASIFKRSATQGLSSITKALTTGIYVGTNLPAELLELEHNMRCLLEDGKNGAKWIEKYLISLGYGEKEIRSVFQRLTGISWEDWFNVEGVITDTPATIPGINYGWGKAKGKDYDYYFIMPWNLGYSVFGQKGDIQRDEVEHWPTLEGARESLSDKVDKPMYFDPPVRPAKGAPWDFPKQNLSEPFPVYISANDGFSKLDSYLYRHASEMPKEQIGKLLFRNLNSGSIDKMDFNELYDIYIKRQAGPDVKYLTDEGEEDKKEEIKEMVLQQEEKESKKPLSESLMQASPMEYLNQKKSIKYDTVPANVIDDVMVYVRDKNTELSDFELCFNELKYASTQFIQDINRTPPLPDLEKDFFDSNAVISLILDVKDRTIPGDMNHKLGMVLFTVIDGSALTNDKLIGEDSDSYAVTDDGLARYFMNERDRDKD